MIYMFFIISLSGVENYILTSLNVTRTYNKGINKYVKTILFPLKPISHCFPVLCSVHNVSICQWFLTYLLADQLQRTYLRL